MVDKTTSGNPTLNQGQDEGDASPNYVTTEQLNSAITARFRSFEARQTESFSRLESMLAEKLSPPAQEEAKPSKKIAEDPMVMALQNQVKILQEKDKKAREQNLRARVQEELLAGGINPKAVKPLLAQFELEKTVSYASEDSEEIVFKTADSVFTLKDGVGSYLTSEDAKPFLAPKGAVGSGDKKYNSTNQKPQEGSKFSSKDQAGSALLELLSGSGD